jgi:hypothetical protein
MPSVTASEQGTARLRIAGGSDETSKMWGETSTAGMLSEESHMELCAIEGDSPVTSLSCPNNAVGCHE